MLRLKKQRVDLQKVYCEKVKPNLTHEEAEAMERALAAQPFKALFTTVADKVHWYLLEVPLALRGKHYGVAHSWKEAEETVRRLLGSTTTNGGLTV